MPLLHNGHVQPLNPIGVHEGHGDSLLQQPSLSHILDAKRAWSFPKSDEDDKMTTLEIVESISGLLYLVFTLVLSAYYLQVLSPSMTNDLWWSGFNASGIQSYLIDVYNTQLNVLGNQTLSIDLTDTKYALGKDYTQFYTPIEISPVYPRMIFSIVAYDLAKSIVAIRQIPGPDWIVSQFCWIDFNRTWEVAHTVTRQNRCTARYTDNGAVYYEPIVRLVDWNEWTGGVYGSSFNTTIGNALRNTRAGQDWLDQTPYSFVNVDVEVEFWCRHGITQYTFQYSNNFAWGELETISLQNAFGTTQAITIKRSAFANRVGSWTTVWMYYGLWNDLPFAAWQGYSFVLNDPDNQRFMPPCNYSNYEADPANYSCDPCDPALGLDSTNCYWNYEMFLDLPRTPTFELVHNYIGPFNSIDLYFVQAPPSLIKLYSDFQTLVTQLILSNEAFATAVAAIPSLTTDPVPPSWIQPSFMYLGGDPTCLTRQPTTFVQTSFAFDTSCSFEERTKFTLTPYNTLFALWATSQRNASSICGVCPSLENSCLAVFTHALDAADLLKDSYSSTSNASIPTIQGAYHDISKLGVSTIQMAINSTDFSNHFLQQEILGSQYSSEWDVFGWLYAYEWAQSSREVVSFEGDANIITLISEKYEFVKYQAQSMEIPRNACQYLWFASVIVSTVLVLAGTFVSFYSVILQGQIVGRNLFYFNRIVGAVWLGRPLLLVRSFTAIILLSTSPVTFQRQNGYSFFKFSPRSHFESMVVAGEASWMTYVLIDIILICRTYNTLPYFASVSTFVSWITIVAIDSAIPYRMTANLDRQCFYDLYYTKLACTSGDIQVGSPNRAMSLVLIQILCVIVAFIINTVWDCRRIRNATNRDFSLLLSSTDITFLHKDTSLNGELTIDRASCAMCGLLTFHNYIFDIKLWVLVHDKGSSRPGIKCKRKVFGPPSLTYSTLKEEQSEKQSQTQSSKTVPVDNPVKFIHRIIMVAGLLYIVATIFGSITYLSLTATNMANDLWWANYNATREHVYVSRLYNLQLNYRPHSGAVTMTDSKFMDEANYSIYTTKVVSGRIKPYYVSRVLSTDASELATVIHGLRVMDACLAPWIASQYCWLDFGKKWEMANSAARQIRCAKNYSTNAAVYLESVLRNVKWPQLKSCWGTSLDVAFGSPLSRQNNGTSWWASIQSISTSEAEELNYWSSFGLKAYLTDWQNYKSIGIIDTFGIQNAFGLVYPMTLKYTNGTLNLDGQTSMKMYWGFASDLWAVTSSSTSIYGASLIRQDASFAFANRTMESVLVQNGTILSSDLKRGGAYTIFRNTFGPFGSVDLKRVPVPPSLLLFASQFSDSLSEQLVRSTNFSLDYSALPGLPDIGFIPPPWLNITTTFGGNLLCNEIESRNLVSGVLRLTAAESQCGSYIGEYLLMTSRPPLAAAIGANLIRSNITTTETDVICTTITTMDNETCTNNLLWPSIRLFLNDSRLSDPNLVPTLTSLAKKAQNEVFQLGVEIIQYVNVVNNTIALARYNIFDPNYPSFDFMAWLLAIDWATNNREVISFQGDLDSVNVLTTQTLDLVSTFNPLEVPYNVAYYIRYVCLYVTACIICVATLVILYIFLHKGRVEGWNFFEINRVAGIVWIGRTSLFVRSMAAICLLSTQSISLEQVNKVWHLVDVNESSNDRAIRFFKTFLAAGEVSWFVYVLNDILMVFTAQYTTAYVIKCTIVVWSASVCFSWLSPAIHVATLDRQCTFAHVDFQLVCTNGTVSIGSFSRFLSLVGLCVGTIVFFYLFERLRRPSLPPSRQESLFLAISAKYMFQHERWIDHKVNCIDPASAAINGILSLQIKNAVYFIDLKLWRFFVISIPNKERERLEKERKYHLTSAIPLTD